MSKVAIPENPVCGKCGREQPTGYKSDHCCYCGTAFKANEPIPKTEEVKTKPELKPVEEDATIGTVASTDVDVKEDTPKEEPSDKEGSS